MTRNELKAEIDRLTRERLEAATSRPRKRQRRDTRTDCCRCERPFADPVTRGRLPGTSRCRDCEAGRQNGYYWQRKAAA